MRIERQLQTAVNNIVKWCDTNVIVFLRARAAACTLPQTGYSSRPEIRIRDIQIPVVPTCSSNTSWGADRTSLPECIRQSYTLPRIDYGCVAYGSACNSTLQKLDPVQLYGIENLLGCFSHITGAESYVNRQLPSRPSTGGKLSLAFYLRSCLVPSHPLQNVYMSTA
ncbi:putative RNA-directed DNA polymerase from transposon BS [Trichonephila clavipes]|nr:putative RNA-directed DNA polymerase from transposon BS [Trichonephila clavipes]